MTLRGAARRYRRVWTRGARSAWVGHLSVALAFAAVAAAAVGYRGLAEALITVSSFGAAFLGGRAVGREHGVELGREIGRLEERLRQGRQT